MSTSMTEESPGVRSSKRVAGISMVSVGVLVLISVAATALFRQSPMPNAQVAMDAGKSLISIGGLLLGVTVLEAFSK